MPEMGAAALSIALCAGCRRETLPRLAQPSWHREKHRATQAEREAEPDPRAEAIKRRKQRKHQQSTLRQQMRVHGIIAATRFFLSLQRPLPAPVIDEDCDRCRREQAR